MGFDRERASFLQVLDEGLGATVNVQFFVNVLEMVMDRPDANGEGAGDLLVQKAFADITEYFLLPGGETGQAGGFVAALSGCKEILEVIPDSRQNLLRGKNPLAQRALNWLKQLGWFPAPKDITGGDAAEGDKDMVAVLINAVQEGGKIRQPAFEPFEELHDRQVGRGAVEEQQFRLFPAD